MDVAHTRGNLALVDGVGAAEQFLRAYREIVPLLMSTIPGGTLPISFSFDSDFAGVMAFNAFGADLLIEDLYSRADEWAHALAKTI